MEGYDGYKDYFYDRRGWLFGLSMVQVVVDVIDTLLKGAAHFTGLGLVYPLASAALIVLFGTAAITRSERYHAAAALLFLAYQFSFAVALFNTVH